MAAERKKTGRPRTTLAKLPDDWQAICKRVGSEGGSAAELRSELGIGRSAWETLLTDEPEFQAAVKAAEDASNVWWERAGRRLALEGGGNAAIWIFNMKNRFGWRDKPEGDDKPDALTESLAKLIDKLPG